ncbi:MAG: hypothetical protein D6800_09640 [Candidatus Zixiibacteriota bacterium]|nr:MAG: hypothetical protein D6800_09640 [candidate division Zixibacteria bacterium]
MIRLILACGVLLMSCSASAAEEGCPAEKAGQAGFTAIQSFHHILAPLWHKSWGEKDFDALLAAGPRFKEAFAQVAAMKPEIKNPERRQAFETGRRSFAHWVDLYAEAAAAKNGDSVYTLLPKLHEAFEKTATALSPYEWAPLDKMLRVTKEMLHHHLPDSNWTELSSAADELARNTTALADSTLPEYLTAFKTELRKRLGALQPIVSDISACCEKKDAKKLSKLAHTLRGDLEQIVADYL